MRKSTPARVVLLLLAVAASLLLGLTASASASAASAPSASAAAEPDRPPVGSDGRLDARAAAGKTDLSATVTGQTTWFSGTVAPGATQFWTWFNANPLFSSYEVGFSPLGASTTAPCRFEVTGTRYERLSSGERRFQFDVKNTSSIACGTTILLSQADDGHAQGNLVDISPGQKHVQEIFLQHNSANRPVPIVGLIPGTVGTTATSPCRFALLDAVNVSTKPGQWVYRVTTQNVGAVTCKMVVSLATVQPSFQLQFGDLAPGAQVSTHWNNANPLNLVYVPLGSPVFLPTGTTCDLQVVRRFYQQKINPDGAVEREFHLTVKNAGVHTCKDTRFHMATLG